MVHSLVSISFVALNLVYSKNKLCKTLGYWSRYMLNFDILENGLGIVSPRHFVYDFLRKIFVMLLISLILINFIVWLPLLLEILGNMCTVITCFSVCYVINFEIKKTKTVGTKFKYFKSQKCF